MDSPTTFSEIERSFHSMPLTKYVIATELEQEWLKTAVADYELDLGCDLQYDANTCTFSSKLSGQTVRILALMMYVSYLQQLHFLTTAAISSNCFSMSLTSLNWVRARSRF